MLQSLLCCALAMVDMHARIIRPHLHAGGPCGGPHRRSARQQCQYTGVDALRNRHCSEYTPSPAFFSGLDSIQSYTSLRLENFSPTLPGASLSPLQHPKSIQSWLPSLRPCPRSTYFCQESGSCLPSTAYIRIHGTVDACGNYKLFATAYCARGGDTARGGQISGGRTVDGDRCEWNEENIEMTAMRLPQPEIWKSLREGEMR
jgi:hypothetical protein